MSKRTAVALSGGLDSSVTALLLKNQGYDVAGVTFINEYSDESILSNAQKVAEKLEIPFYSVDVSKEFHKNVIKYFEETYYAGKTPNPCLMCNRYIKWGVLFDYAIKELGCDYLATGHYADIRNDGGVYKLYPASDEHKDQLYFLFMLTQNQLSRTLFPLSRYKKEEVRRMAAEYDLPNKSAKESQDICFIKPPMTAKKYLNCLFTAKEGNFVQKSDGKILGRHTGFWQYTVGQRKGIGLSAPEPLYVTGIDASSNTVYLGRKEELYSKTLRVKNLILNSPETSLDVLVKIRYNMKAVHAHIEMSETEAEILFSEPVSAVTKGQACVVYDIKDGHLLGGTFIE